MRYGREWLSRNPTNVEFPEKIGIKPEIKEALYDLVISGDGPAGLASPIVVSGDKTPLFKEWLGE